MSIVEKRFVPIALALCLSLLGGRAASAQEIVRVSGTGAGVALMGPIIEAFEKENRGVRVHLEKSLGSSASIKAVAKNALDLAITSRPLKPAESAEGLLVSEYGKSPFVVVTNLRTKESNVSLNEVAGMFSGKIPKWSNGDYVRVVLRPNEDSDTKIMRAISPEMDLAVTAAQARKDMLLGITDNDAFESVKKTPGTIAFMALTLPLSQPGGIKVMQLDGRQGSVTAMARGKYPFVKPLYLVTRKGAAPAVDKFVSFLNSKKGKSIAVRHGLLTAGNK
ncbi:ABC transporter substrate-binding protein [Geoanaerobacter pelophilus]|uniref:ABC transporter substrate-binding protein n=1 Tax=Geoanaerobacter pelophilus TaxID=60036 RepID=A0ABQ0MLH8_9BACT|nr:substrate-binding domain-containing protein [Geoanaerobacter pelophilus]GAW67647.1 ABC transporter substrate-binding protein [Geoanaerobacter pelophilus]